MRRLWTTLLRISVGAVFVAALSALAAAQESSGAALQPLAVGAAMEDFGLRSLNLTSGQLDQIVWLSDYVGPDSSGRPRKKLLLLSFFATWCKPCLAELPELARLQARYGASGLQVLSVNVRKPSEAVDATIAEARRVQPASGLGFPMLFDRFTTRAQLLYLGDRAALPCNVLIDASGTIVARMLGAASEPTALEASVRTGLGFARSGGPP